ncbi:hypothetical protein NDGK_01074 [Clostridiales bacterium CHKCI001]|nr:hypothetical protein NDGK_01074 [Clostridiales bacterium CHKCI001]
MKKLKRQFLLLLSFITSVTAVMITFQTRKRLKESIPFTGYTHSHLTKKISEHIVASEPKQFQKGILKIIFGTLTYDMSHLQFPNISYLECDVHLGAVTILIPSNVNVILESKSLLGNCASLTGRYLEDDIPQLYIKAHAYLANLSVRCIDDFQS